MANIQKIRDLAGADFSPHEIAKLLNLPIELVKKDSAHIARTNRTEGNFLQSLLPRLAMHLSPGGPGAPVTIIGSLPVGCNVNLIYTGSGALRQSKRYLLIVTKRARWIKNACPEHARLIIIWRKLSLSFFSSCFNFFGSSAL